MDGWMDGWWMDGWWVGGWMDGWWVGGRKEGRKEGRADGRTDGRTDGWMDKWRVHHPSELSVGFSTMVDLENTSLVVKLEN